MKVANVGYGVRSNILRVELQEMKHVMIVFSGRAKSSTQMVNKNDYFSFLGLRRTFRTRDSPVDDFLFG